MYMIVRFCMNVWCGGSDIRVTTQPSINQSVNQSINQGLPM